MAAAQQHFQYPQGKGTLAPGQTIVVNKYTIQVERYLSQGGFAHVYLVRTATPVYNTTHHVLKRIAAPDQAMLAEVKKEVDIMRLLKGHPNIVHFIDAAWHKMPNGMFEVFILMEYCPGGGIIDMMNRRLRERLTEAEILQIFVDVCEAVACMHNLRPPLLHRDLKVENILQSSQTSYKLCDFGSATPIAKVPTNMQELRMVEADLNKHTTMQYRAPEMIDVHMRRPIDEKSDVWALGVLLYKLCYYTTPFEEHGPLAILQVSYRIPPYPVYSPQLNALIAKMLKDHGTMRPTVFDVLVDVHRMRGTKSQFQYTVPIPEPLTPSRISHHKQLASGALDGVISYKSKSPQKHQSSASVSPIKNQGQLAREKVMEAIAPMRRGRPTSSKDSLPDTRLGSRPSSPQKEVYRSSIIGTRITKVNLDEINLADDEKAWKTWATEVTKQSSEASSLNDDAWKIETDKVNVKVNAATGFNDNFAESVRVPDFPTLAPQAASRPATALSSAGISSSLPKESSLPVRHAAQATAGILPRKIPLPRTQKDAFDGLGLEPPAEKLQPTLGEARKLRTGLATLSSTRPSKPEPENRPLSSPKPSAFLTPQPYMQTQGFLSASPSNASSTGSATQATSRPPSSMNIDGMPAESRFPSLEELDATFSVTNGKSRSPSRPPFSAKSTNVGSPLKQLQEQTPASPNDTVPNKNAVPTSQEKQGSGHTRIFELGNDSGDSLRLDKGRALPSTMVGDLPPRRVSSLSLKPTVTRRQRASISFRQKHTDDSNDSPSASKFMHPAKEETPPHPRASPSQPRDWLTGDENLPPTPAHIPNLEIPILRRSLSKRASVIEKSDILIREAVAAQPEQASVVQRVNKPSDTVEISPTVTKFTQLYPAIETAGKGRLARPLGKSMDDSSSSSADEEPEDVNGLSVAIKSGSLGRSSRRRPRESSVHDLVDLWGGKDMAQSQIGEERVSRKQLAVESSSILKSPLSGERIPFSESKTPMYLEPREQQTDISSRNQISPGRKSPSSGGRPRPQSLFLFPSRSTDNSSHQSSLLETPADSKRHQSRRNSITDMVERYEAMRGTMPQSGQVSRPPSPLAVKKTTSGKSPTQLEARHTSKPLDTGASLAVPPSPSTVIGKQRSSPTRTKISAGFPVSPAERRIFPEVHKPAEISQARAVNGVETGLPRPRRLSLKPYENPKPPVSLQDLLASDEGKERPPVTSERSPSPERSYQGVGKLIDQWQRKAEAAEPGRPAAKPSTPTKRSSVITKRPTTAVGDLNNRP